MMLRLARLGVAPLAAALTLSVLALPSQSAAQPTDTFLCYKAKRPKGAPKFATTTVAVTDELQTRPLDVKMPKMVCAPVDLGAGLIDPDTSLLAYEVRAVKGSTYSPGAGVEVLDGLGELYVDTKPQPQFLLVPTATDPDADPAPPDPAEHALDHYRCHKTKTSEGHAPLPSGLQIALQGQASGPALLDVKKARHLCEPVDALGVEIKHAGNHLMCYQVRRARGEPKSGKIASLRVSNQFGAAALDTVKEFEICLPARAIDLCNGFAELCDRAYDAVAYPTTHNAMSNAEEGWLLPNQSFAVNTQLDDGVRGLMLDTWYFGGDVVLCHGGDLFPCDLTGMKPLVDGLAEIKGFLDRRPNEIVSIIFESYVSEADTEADFVASGLIDDVHVQPIGEPWPTLRELIEDGTRLVVFTDDSGATLPWHHYVWDFAWETHFSFENPEDFSCTINRGSMQNSLFILNHFLTRFVGSPVLADMVNHNPLFIDRAEQCLAESGRLPNFVTVDYYNIGDLFPVVDSLNGVGDGA
jgi:hypothetical protein